MACLLKRFDRNSFPSTFQEWEQFKKDNNPKTHIKVLSALHMDLQKVNKEVFKQLCNLLSRIKNAKDFQKFYASIDNALSELQNTGYISQDAYNVIHTIIFKDEQ